MSNSTFSLTVCQAATNSFLLPFNNNLLLMSTSNSNQLLYPFCFCNLLLLYSTDQPTILFMPSTTISTNRALFSANLLFFNLSFSATFHNHFLLPIQPSCNQPILLPCLLYFFLNHSVCLQPTYVLTSNQFHQPFCFFLQPSASTAQHFFPLLIQLLSCLIYPPPPLFFFGSDVLSADRPSWRGAM